MCGINPLYDHNSPYPRIETSTVSPPLVVTTSRATFWFGRLKSIMRNTSTHPATIVFGTATWLHSFLFLGKTMWFPAVSVLVLSAILHQGWQALDKAMGLLPTLDSAKYFGWDSGVIVVCLLSGWVTFLVANHYLKRWYRYSSTDPSCKTHKGFVPPTESSPATSFIEKAVTRV